MGKLDSNTPKKDLTDVQQELENLKSCLTPRKPPTPGPRGRLQYPNSRKSSVTSSRKIPVNVYQLQLNQQKMQSPTEKELVSTTVQRGSEEHAASSLMSQAPAKLCQRQNLRGTTP